MPVAPTPSSAPAQGQSQQAPFGATQATAPSPNRGFEAAGMQKMGSVVKMLEEIIGQAGATSEVGKAALECLNKLVKLVPAGSVSPAAQKNNIDQMAMRNAQNNQQMQALRQQMAQGQGQAA